MKIITIGRTKENDIVINDPENLVSSAHAEIVVSDDGTISIRDKNSTNGTTINGSPLKPNELVTITRHDRIVLAEKITLDWGRIEVELTPSVNIRKIYRIGRNPSNDIVINDPKKMVSGDHARLELMNDGKIYLIDSSKNGTTVNGTRLSNQRRQVNRNDLIVFADTATLDWSNIEQHDATVATQRVKPPEVSPVPNPISGPKGQPIQQRKAIKRSRTPYFIIGAALLVSALILVFKDSIFPPTTGEIGEKYQNAVVCISHKYYYTIQQKSSEGNPKILFWIGVDKKSGGFNFPKFISDAAIQATPVSGIDNKLIEHIAPFDIEGTGFCVSKNQGLILSNKHVLYPSKIINSNTVETYKLNRSIIDRIREAQNKASAMSPNIDLEIGQYSVFLGVALNGKPLNSEGDFYEGNVLAYSKEEDVDLAVMRLNEKAEPAKKYMVEVPMSSVRSAEKIELNENLIAIGFPKGSEFGKEKGSQVLQATSQTGSVNKIPDKVRFVHSIETQPGASGSPIFDSRGRLVGVAYGYYGIANESNTVSNVCIRADLIPPIMKSLNK